MSVQRALVIVGLFSFWVSAARAARPWEPHVSVPSREGVAGTIKKALEPEVLKRFDKAYERGRFFLGQGKYREAHSALSDAIQLYPDHAEARLLRARSSLTLGYLGWNHSLIAECLADLFCALDLDPGNREILSLADLLADLAKRMNPSAAKPPHKGRRTTPKIFAPREKSRE